MIDIEKKVIKMVSEIANKPVLINQQLMAENLINSIQAVDLALMIENEFGARVRGEDIAQTFISCSSIVKFIHENSK